MQTDKIVKNIKFSFINYVVINSLKFLVRMVFIANLSIEYLGINGLFTNVLSMLSLVELGIGPAIVYSLYKPLSVADKDAVKSIMHLFKQAYIAIGIVIFILGLCLYPWIDFFIKDNSQIADLQYFYLLFLFNTVISYFWSYKRNLLVADQKQYFVNAYQAAVQIAVALAQIIFLYLIPNYWFFIILMVLGTIGENLLIAHKADKEYPYLKETALPLDTGIKKKIVQNTKAMIMHKIGGIIVFSSSNIIISKFVGLVAVGLYSNYFMVIGAMNTFSSKFFEAITASIGNLVIVESEQEKAKSFKLIEFITAFQASLAAVGLYVLFNPFMELWLGSEYLFDDYTVLCIVISFYLMYMRKAVLMFKDACGLFWQDRYKPVAESVINFTAAVYLAMHFGTIGAVCGGIISTLATCFWVEPYILFKYGLQSISLKHYFKEYIKYTVLTVVIALVADGVYAKLLWGISLVNFLLGILVVIVLVIIFWLVVFGRRWEFLMIKNMLGKRR